MPQIRNFDDAHTLLSKYVDRKKQPGSYSLDRMRQLMAQLGNPQDNYKIIHVAGTSGKTSTCYYLTALLKSAGQKVGLTVSPHVDEINERVQVNLKPLPEKQFCRQLEKFINKVEKLKIEPTYFELLVAFAFWEFNNQKVDYAVIEVGLGGLLDGTNVINRRDKICVITDIGLDHTSVLGNTLAEISTQKAGIIQNHNYIFMYQQSAEVIAPVEARCRQKHAVLCRVEPNKFQANFKQRNYYLAKNVFDFVAKNEGWPKLGAGQLSSAQKLNIPARMEVFEFQGKTIIIDGSHNGQKVGALVEAIKNEYNQPAALMVSFVNREANRAAEVFEQLKKLTNKVIVTSFAGARDMPNVSYQPTKIAQIAKQTGFKQVEVVDKPEAAFEHLVSQPEDLLVVTGSFYLLNHIRPLILKP